MPTFRRVPAGAASGLRFVRIGAAYGTQRTNNTMAAAHQAVKPIQIAPAKWNYEPGKVTLVKAAK